MEPTGNYDLTQPRGIMRSGSWTREEDVLLRKCIEKYGEANWNQVPVRAGLNRCRKSCRLRWFNYLHPNIKHGEFAMDEVDLIIRMHKLLGNRWSLIAGRLPGRTANHIKNYWNTHLKQSKQRPKSNVRMNINKVDCKQMIRNDHQSKVLVIRPKPHSFSENSKWINGKSILMPRSTDIGQPASSSSMMVTKSADSNEPLPEFLTDVALTSWWQENIDTFIDDDRMKKKKKGILLAEKVINSGCCSCRCNKSTDDQSTAFTDQEQDLSVDDYLWELQNIPWDGTPYMFMMEIRAKREGAHMSMRPIGHASPCNRSAKP